MLTQMLLRLSTAAGIVLMAATAMAQAPPAGAGPPTHKASASAGPSIIHKIQGANERLELTVHTSRILTLDQKIPQAQVNNPDLVELVPLSPTQVQLSAKAAGVTQVNLWSEDKKVYTIDVIVYGDAQELAMHLRAQFPKAALKVTPIANSVVIGGYVDRPEHVDRIIQIAEQYYPKVINNITVGGVQQVLLHVKVMEASRTKLRRLGFDFAHLTDGNRMLFSGISGLLSIDPDGLLKHTGAEKFSFRILDGQDVFLGVLEAMRQHNLLKVMAEPTLITVSGRPAFFQVGGEIPILVPQSFGSVSIEFKKYGTQVDFVPIVLGNGRIRLEVRPRVSEIDQSRNVVISSSSIPGFRVREVDTGVEMQVGQTLAIAGLVQHTVEAENRGVPVVADIPYIGALFRRVEQKANEVELLIMVTPELVEAMDADQVPPCGPGTTTTEPNDCELYLKGHLEVPNCCPVGAGAGCGNCGGPGGPVPGPMGGLPLEPMEEIPGVPPKGSAGAGAYNRQNPPRPQTSRAGSASRTANGGPGFLGPVGYDVVN